MYDKVKLWIGGNLMNGTTPQQIAMLLDEAKEQTDLKTGEVKTFGCLGGLKVSVNVGGVSVVGSLPKFYYGNNIYPLDRHTTAKAFEKLGNSLHLNVDEAKVTGFEFGTTFPMKYPVRMYLQKFGDAPRLERYPVSSSTLYYQPKGRVKNKIFCFYNKGLEEKAKGLKLPTGFEDANLLRYEIRFNGKLARQLKQGDVFVKTLYEHRFYQFMIKMYQDSYYSISKTNQIKTNVMDEIKTVDDAYDVFVARLVSQQGGYDQITSFIGELKDAQVFNDPKYYTRLKKKIQGNITKQNITVVDELIRELNDDINNIAAYM